MNNFFSLPRFLFLIGAYWSDRMKNILLLFLAIAAALSLWYGINIMMHVSHIFDTRNQIVFYFLGLFLTGCLTGSMLFSNLSSGKPRAIAFLLLPVSSFEKLLCALLFGVAGFFIGYSIVFLIVDTLLVNLANNLLHTAWPVLDIFSLNTYEPQLGDEPNTMYLWLYFALQSGFMLGSVYFKSNPLFKTIVAMLLVWAGFVMLMWSLRHTIPPGMGRDDHLVYEVFDPSGYSKIITLPPILHLLDSVFLKFGITIGLWTAAYFRLTEKQIV